jgi:hypothetical protein
VSVEIVEIMGRSEQGVTRPFICRGDDGHVYFVKGRGAGMRSLICEWIAGQLGRRLGLPIAPFEIVEVGPELIEIATRSDMAELGAGLAFGSQKLPVIELSATHVQYVPDEQQRDVLVFDWWVQNADRTLGEAGGNPNLFWDVEQENLVVIDHNQAFDKSFVIQDFVETHAFRHQMHAVASDGMLQKDYCSRFERAMTDWSAICDTVPPEWWFVDLERTVPTDFDREAAQRLLMRFQADGFWSWK